MAKSKRIPHAKEIMKIPLQFHEEKKLRIRKLTSGRFKCGRARSRLLKEMYANRFHCKDIEKKNSILYNSKGTGSPILSGF